MEHQVYRGLGLDEEDRRNEQMKRDDLAIDG